MYSFDIYLGNKGGARQTGLAETVVTRFSDLLPVGRFIIITDSYFGGMSLAIALHTSGRLFILGCTAIRPSFLFKEDIHKSYAKWSLHDLAWRMCSGGIAAVTWKDKKHVNYLTNYCSPTTTENDLPSVVSFYRQHYHAVGIVKTKFYRKIISIGVTSIIKRTTKPKNGT